MDLQKIGAILQNIAPFNYMQKCDLYISFFCFSIYRYVSAVFLSQISSLSLVDFFQESRSAILFRKQSNLSFKVGKGAAAMSTDTSIALLIMMPPDF